MSRLSGFHMLWIATLQVTTQISIGEELEVTEYNATVNADQTIHDIPLRQTGAVSVQDSMTVPADGFSSRPITRRKRWRRSTPGRTVVLALKWAAEAQERDGHWDARKHGANEQNDVAVTSLALLGFLGAGHNEKIGMYKDTVRRAVHWLRSRQSPNGCIVDTNADDVPIHQHAIAGWALAEAAGMANIADTKKAAQRAVDYSIKELQRANGGFACKANESSSLIATVWFALQLKSAKVAGLKVPSVNFEKIDNFLDRVERKGAGGDMAGVSIYVNIPEETEVDDAHRLTAIGCLTRQLLGAPKDELEASVRWLVKEGGIPDAWNEETDLCHWYFKTLCAYQQGGYIWKYWNEPMKQTLIRAKRTGGKLDGSWDPVGRHGNEWGRVGQTAFVYVCLEVYFRFLGVYRQ